SSRGPVPDARNPIGIDSELVRGRSLGAERTAVDGTIGIALDVDDRAVADRDELAATHGAVGADTGHLPGLDNAGLLESRSGGVQVQAQAEPAAQGKAAADGRAQEGTPVQFRGRA